IPKSRMVNGQYPGHSVVFDPASGAINGKTNKIYVSSYGNGTYRSTDAGASWVALSGGPATTSHSKIATDGTYYVAEGATIGVWRYLNGWTNITPSTKEGLWDTVVTDPFNSNHVIAVRNGGYLNISYDRWSTWSGTVYGPNGANSRVATDIPWLAWTNE